MEFRTPRPAQRVAMNRPRPAPPLHRPAESLQPAKEVPKTVQRAASPVHTAKKKKSPKRFLLPIIGIAVVAVLGVTGWFVWSGGQSVSTAIDSTKYQAVFFTDGQVYFGKLHAFNGEYMKLSDIYYLQAQSKTEADSANPQKVTTNQNNAQLIKLGNEVHGPQDEMIISKAQVLFFENLKSDGNVAQSIEKSKNSN